MKGIFVFNGYGCTTLFDPIFRSVQLCNSSKFLTNTCCTSRFEAVLIYFSVLKLSFKRRTSGFIGVGH